MEFVRDDDNETATWAFKGELTIYNVGQLKQAMFHEWETIPNNLALDLQNVSELDTAGVQLLLFTQKFFGEQGKPVVISQSNPLVENVLKSLNVDHFFSYPSANEVKQQAIY